MSALWQMVQVAGAIQVLCRRTRRCRPWWINEVEELAHVGLRCISRGERLDSIPGLNKFQDRGRVHHRMGNVVLLGEGRDHDERHAIACPGEIACRTRASV